MTPRLGDRSLFPDLAYPLYLNHAAVSPPPLPARTAAIEVVDTVARLGVSSFPLWNEHRDTLRATLARLLGGQPADYGFVANTTTGVVHIAWSYRWSTGDGVLLFDGEFPANRTPWQQAASHFGLRVHTLPLDGFGDGSGDGLARVEAALAAGGIRMVAVSAVQFSTGLAMPIEALASLCHAHGARLFVDGIQAAGVVPMDLAALGVDYFTAGSHKWLMGLEGCALLYVAPDAMADLEPRTVGWLSHEDGLGFLSLGHGHLRYDRPFQQRPSVFEGGAYNTVGLRTVLASAELLESLGIPKIFAHVQAWHDAAEPGLVERGFQSLRATEPGGRSGILALRPPPHIDGPWLLEALADRGVGVSLPDGNLRLAPHWPNSLQEPENLLQVLDELVAGN